MSILYVIATPIGNLEDITLRAIRILKEVEIIFCEDTRVTRKLLSHFEIYQKKLISCNKENESKRIKELLNHLDSGRDLALVSDAGTPLISDPGSEILKGFYEHNQNMDQNSKMPHKICPIPGPSALTAALSVANKDISRFVFEGFLPHGPKQRRKILRKLAGEERPLVFFESPHRILKTLMDIKNILLNSNKDKKSSIFVAREISKKFEEFYSGTIEEVLEKLTTQFPEKAQGEFVIIF